MQKKLPDNVIRAFRHNDESEEPPPTLAEPKGGKDDDFIEVAIGYRDDIDPDD